MEIYEFIRDSLMWMATVALLWPLNVPIMGLAIKVLFGAQPIDMEDYEYWGRATLAALGVAVATAAMLVLDHLLVTSAEIPPGPVHMVMFAAYVAAASYVIHMVYNLEDFFQAAGGFVIYVFLPITVLYIVNWLFGWWRPMLNFTGSWLEAVQ